MAVNPLHESILAIILPQTVEANECATRIKNATSGVSTMVHDIRESSDDEKVAAYREYKDDLEAKLLKAQEETDAYIKANLLPASEVIDVPAETERHAKLVAVAKEGRKYFAVAGGDLSTLPPLLTSKGNASGSTGTGGKRPRLEMITCDGVEVKGERPGMVNGKPDGTTVVTHTFTDLAKFLSDEAKVSVKAKDLQAAAFEAAGTDDLSTKPGNPIYFTVTYGEGDKAHTYAIEVTPSDKDKASDTSDDSADENLSAENVETEVTA